LCARIKSRPPASAGQLGSSPLDSACAHHQGAEITRSSISIDEFFSGRPESRRLFDALSTAISELGPVEIRVTRSQVAFWRTHPFAWAWVPGKYIHGDHAPLVLTVSLRRHDLSPRWKEVVQPARGRFTHHLELRQASEIDDQIRSLLKEASSLAE